MAYYNNGFPASYQPVYQYQAPQAAQTAQGNLIWVQGEAAAKSYLVAPNTTVQLWDSEEKVIYLKSADASGMPSMKVLDYTIRGEQAAQPVAQVPEYATKDELNALAEKIREIRDEMGRRRSRLLKDGDGDE